MIPKNLFEEVRLRFIDRIENQLLSCFSDKQLRINSAGKLKPVSILSEISTSVKNLEPLPRICFLVLMWRYVVEPGTNHSGYQRRVAMVILRSIVECIKEIKPVRARIQIVGYLREYEVNNMDCLLCATLETFLLRSALCKPTGYVRRAVVELVPCCYWLPEAPVLRQRLRECICVLRDYLHESSKTVERKRELKLLPYRRPSPGSVLTGTFD